MKKTGIELIAAERAEQLEKHGRTVERDRGINDVRQLAKAAQIMVIANIHPKAAPSFKPADWDPDLWDKMCAKSYKDRLVIAGALIAAEIDRISE